MENRAVVSRTACPLTPVSILVKRRPRPTRLPGIEEKFKRLIDYVERCEIESQYTAKLMCSRFKKLKEELNSLMNTNGEMIGGLSEFDQLIHDIEHDFELSKLAISGMETNLSRLKAKQTIETCGESRSVIASPREQPRGRSSSGISLLRPPAETSLLSRTPKRKQHSSTGVSILLPKRHRADSHPHNQLKSVIDATRFWNTNRFANCTNQRLLNVVHGLPKGEEDLVHRQEAIGWIS